MEQTTIFSSGEVFNPPAYSQFLDPLFVWHVRRSSGEVNVCREQILIRCEKLRIGNEEALAGSR